MAGYLPEIFAARLPNGVQVVSVEYRRVPWLSLRCMIKRGAEVDPPGKAGVADWTAEYLTLGTRKRSQKELAETVEALGARLHSWAEFDATYISLEGLAEDFPQLMALLAEVVQTPAFPEEEFPLLRERRRAELAQILDNPRELANRKFYRLFFGKSPYGHAIRGEPESVDALQLSELVRHYRREFTPATTTLVAVGMVSHSQVLEVAGNLWSEWHGNGPPSPPYEEVPATLAKPGLYFLDRPELTQSEIRLGHLGLPRSHPDFFPLKLLNYVVGGGGFSSRLMTRIRSELGLTYGIRSRFHFRRAPGAFTIATFTPAQHTAQVVAEVVEVLKQVKSQGITQEELREAQDYYVGHFPLGLETPRELARKLLLMDLYELGWDYLHRYCERVREVTREKVLRAAATHLHPEDLVVLVVGPAAAFQEALERLGPLVRL